MKTIALFGFVLGALSAAGRVVVTKPGMTVILECGVRSYSRSLEWQREKILILRQSASGFPVKGIGDIVKRSAVRQTNLRISGVQKEDAGKFTCVADGTAADVTLVVVSVSANPSAELQLGSEVTLQCQVSGLDSDLAVQWRRPGGAQAPAGHEVQLKSVARSDGGTWTCTFSHADGPHSESLEIRVQEPSTTPVLVTPQKPKDGKKETCADCGTKTSSKDNLLLGLSWWMWVIVGVGCLVVVLLLVLVICLYKRIKRKKRKLQKLKNSRLPLTTKQYCQCNRPTAAAKPQQGRRREKPSAPPLQPLLME